MHGNTFIVIYLNVQYTVHMYARYARETVELLR